MNTPFHYRDLYIEVTITDRFSADFGGTPEGPRYYIEVHVGRGSSDLPAAVTGSDSLGLAHKAARNLLRRIKNNHAYDTTARVRAEILANTMHKIWKLY